MNYWEACTKGRKLATKKGSFGLIYKCNNVAEKKFSNVVTEYGIESSSIREFGFLNKLKNKNIVTLLGTYQFKSDIYLYTRWAFSDLGDYIRRKDTQPGDKTGKRIELSDQTIKDYTFQIGNGLLFMHSMFIAHGDLKPENILLYKEDDKIVLKIADFGMSRHLGDPNSEMKATTSPYYTPPEIILGITPIRFKMDIWQYGLILVEMKLGYNPFLPETYRDIDDLMDEMIEKMMQLLGEPVTDRIYDELYEDYYLLMDGLKTRTGGEKYPQHIPWKSLGLSSYQLAVVDMTLQWDPDDRFNISEIINSKYFDDGAPDDNEPYYLKTFPFIEGNISKKNVIIGSNVALDSKTSGAFFLGTQLYHILTHKSNIYDTLPYSLLCYHIAMCMMYPYKDNGWFILEETVDIPLHTWKQLLKSMLEAFEYELWYTGPSDDLYRKYYKEEIDEMMTLDISLWLLTSFYLEPHTLTLLKDEIVDWCLYIASLISDDDTNYGKISPKYKKLVIETINDNYELTEYQKKLKSYILDTYSIDCAKEYLKIRVSI